MTVSLHMVHPKSHTQELPWQAIPPHVFSGKEHRTHCCSLTRPHQILGLPVALSASVRNFYV